jgi:ubiquitin-conjugating enzyme E2 O
VTRCWADEQNPEQVLEAERLGILDFKPLEVGKLQVLLPNGDRLEIKEQGIKIVDRGFLRGDLVKHNSTPSQSGVIVSIDSKVQLQRVLPSTSDDVDVDIKGQWFDSKDLVASARLNRGDHVIFQDWVGLIEEVFEMAMLELESGQLTRVCDVGSNLSVGKPSDLVKSMLIERTNDDGGFLSNFLGTTSNSQVKNILEVKQLSIAVNWLCRNPQKETKEEDWKRPKRYWSQDMNELKLVRATADHLRTIHDKLIFRDREFVFSLSLSLSMSLSSSSSSLSLSLV